MNTHSKAYVRGRAVRSARAVGLMFGVMVLSGCTSAAPDPAASTAPSGGATSTMSGAQAPPGAATPLDWSSIAAKVEPSVVAISVSTGSGGGAGSGVILDKAGHVVTNHHVVSAGAGPNARILVTLANERVFDATIVGSDPASDLAVLQISNPPSDLTPIALGQSDDLVVGDPVMAVGNPLGLDGTVTTGIVSALNRPVTAQSGSSAAAASAEPVVTNAIQTSAAINPGNSGGALVDEQGRLVGINSSIASLGQNSGNIGIGFAITSRQMKSVVDQILKTGTVQHAYLGVGVGVRDSVVEFGGVRRWAATVLTVTPDSPAAAAGMREGDAVIAIDGESVDSGLSLIAQVRERPVGTKVKLTIVRGGKQQDIDVTLAARPES